MRSGEYESLIKILAGMGGTRSTDELKQAMVAPGLPTTWELSQYRVHGGYFSRCGSSSKGMGRRGQRPDTACQYSYERDLTLKGIAQCFSAAPVSRRGRRFVRPGITTFHRR